MEVIDLEKSLNEMSEVIISWEISKLSPEDQGNTYGMLDVRFKDLIYKLKQKYGVNSLIHTYTVCNYIDELDKQIGQAYRWHCTNPFCILKGSIE
jgi:hypothetical protein